MTPVKKQPGTQTDNNRKWQVWLVIIGSIIPVIIAGGSTVIYNKVEEDKAYYKKVDSLEMRFKSYGETQALKNIYTTNKLEEIDDKIEAMDKKQSEDMQKIYDILIKMQSHE